MQRDGMCDRVRERDGWRGLQGVRLDYSQSCLPGRDRTWACVFRAQCNPHAHAGQKGIGVGAGAVAQRDRAPEPSWAFARQPLPLFLLGLSTSGRLCSPSGESDGQVPGILSVSACLPSLLSPRSVRT